MAMASDTRVRIDAGLEAEIRSQLCAGIYADVPETTTAEIDGVTGRGVENVTLENGDIVFVMTDGERISIGALPVPEIPVASADTLGAVKVGENMTMDENGRLSADVSDRVSQGDKRPVSGGAVYELIGEIETALSVL